MLGLEQVQPLEEQCIIKSSEQPVNWTGTDKVSKNAAEELPRVLSNWEEHANTCFKLGICSTLFFSMFCIRAIEFPAFALKYLQNIFYIKAQLSLKFWQFYKDMINIIDYLNTYQLYTHHLIQSA